MKNQMLCSSCDESTTDSEEIDDEYSSLRSEAASKYCWWRWGSTAKVKFDDDDQSHVKTGLMSCHRPTVTDVTAAEAATARMRVVRELERLALVATQHEGLNELRHKLLMYRSGDFWMPTGGIAKENMDIPPLATILLVGFSASGKSSLVNLMYSVLGRSGLIHFAQTSSGTGSTRASSIILKEHNVLRSLRSGFCVYDSRGFNYDRINEGLEELSSWIKDGVHHNQVCISNTLGPGDDFDDLDGSESESWPWNSNSKFVRRRVNCAMVVANMAEIYKAFQAGDSKPMEATRQLFCSDAFTKYCNDDQRPMLILTHGDMLSSEERIEARLKICDWLGISSERNGVYDIVACLSEYGFVAQEPDPVSAYALAEAVYRALLLSDTTHLPKKTAPDWAIFILSSIMCFLASLFALLAHLCLKLARPHKQRRSTSHRFSTCL